MDVAVVGGGIFGVTAALRLAAQGRQVVLFERRPDILLSASGINQYRLHRGYHYPRSRETAVAARDGAPQFAREFPTAVLDDHEHYYAIAARGSLTTPEAYLRFLEDVGLEQSPADPGVLRPGSTSLVLKARESVFDVDELRRVCRGRLARAGVEVRLGHEATWQDLEPFSHRVIASYRDLNRLLSRAEGATREYQFEVCEKPVVRPPRAYVGKSVVVMDGPFMCLDPFGRTGLSVMGHVDHALHHVNVGAYPEIPPHLEPLLDRGVLLPSDHSRFKYFRDAASEFFHDSEMFEHVGSMFTVRAVLPRSDRTDARPTLVTKIDHSTFSVFSGKIVTCIEAADDIANMIGR